MRFIWKIIFLIYNLALICVGGLFTLLALGTYDGLTDFAEAAKSSTYNRMVTLTLGLACIIVGLIMILFAFYRRKKKTLTVKTDKGSKVTISMKAAQNMVLQSLLGIPGIREVTPEIISNGRSVAVRLHVTVESRQNVPELCEEMERRVKEHLMKVSGIRVSSVTLLVENVIPAGRSRTSGTGRGSLPAGEEKRAERPGKRPAKESRRALFGSRKKPAAGEEAPEEEKKTVVEEAAAAAEADNAAVAEQVAAAAETAEENK